jgi:MoxR-like ATPase
MVETVSDAILTNIKKVIVGSEEALALSIYAFLAGGHILIEDAPGVGKTTLAKALSKSVKADFKRVQFTPDLLPADVTGTSIYQPSTQSFCFKQGPVFCNILLADEINRASPRTQSALLEAMSEGQVSADGETTALPSPFLVIATQNPVEQHGTYPLPEAQLDRFAVKISMGYPEKKMELEMLEQQALTHPLDSLEAVVSLEDVEKAIKNVTKVRVDPMVADYMVCITRASREHPSVRMGVSPRGSKMLYRIAQSCAWSDGRDFVTPDDVKKVAVSTLGHRIIVEARAKYSGISGNHIIEELLNTISVPV